VALTHRGQRHIEVMVSAVARLRLVEITPTKEDGLPGIIPTCREPGEAPLVVLTNLVSPWTHLTGRLEPPGYDC
jgi:hypothetical protein